MGLDIILTRKPRNVLGAELGSFVYSEGSHTPEQQCKAALNLRAPHQ